MDSPFQHAFTVFMGFFAIMNPIANVPIFLGLTGGDDRRTAASVALRSVLLAFIIVTLFAIAGKIIFQLFGLTLPAFRITGGLIVFIIGYHMLSGNHSSLHHPGESKDAQAKSRKAALGVAVSPLAMPILAGPGTIATAMSFSAGGGLRNIGENALGAITRLMGLILAVIGTQMVIGGMHGAFTILHG